MSNTSTSTDAAATPAAAPTDARALGLAHYAARGVLEHVLARHGVTFQQQIALRAAVTTDIPQTPDELIAQVQGSLKTGPADIRSTLDELLAGELLVTDGPHLLPTDAGRALFAAIGADTAPVTARVWGSIPTEDLATAGRVLALVTERANAELAKLTA
ncbi:MULTISPECIES: MarR family transcriptional regulator [unclassified Streptomyces]|uniref:MarR family transcriptional regulator n=1 Tax=unclassified Streptomyces TaxID=2593676 RepID=UPI000DC7E48C|nr:MULTISPECIES: MarR family transcriptional regulator [unclassified Streptomyces]AWZ04888.1 MarR family transcriptional regulator [Streptomyces sp. ICC4]AWZ16387.1 MarR family transcriptional regulator [Streptomyces sp. ICC1]